MSHGQQRDIMRMPATSLTVTLVGLLMLSVSSSFAAFVLPEPSFPIQPHNVTTECKLPDGRLTNIVTKGEDCSPAMNITPCHQLGVCRLDCPTRTDFPDLETPLVSPTWTEIPGCQVSTEVPTGGPAPANNGNGHLSINGSSDCIITNDSATITAGRLSLSMWILPACDNNCTLAFIGDIRVFIDDNKLCVNAFCGSSVFTAWTHLVLQISGDKLTYAVNGAFNISGGHIVGVIPLTEDFVSVTLGISSEDNVATDQGYQLYDVRYYSDILTFREIQQLVTNGTLQDAGILSECRCPFSHLTLSPTDPYTCENESGDKAHRLDVIPHTAEALLDGDPATSWAAPVDSDVLLTFNLQDEYQVEMVEVVLREPFPGRFSLILNDHSHYFHCVNTSCTLDLQLDTQNTSVDMFKDRVSNIVRLHCDTSNVTSLLITSLTFSGRCNCNGNAGTCNILITPYVCDCDNSTNTQGHQCQYCASNRFRETDQFDCQGLCDCNPSGVTDQTQMCMMNGGNCSCKPNVIGDRCDACKEWTYGLDPFSSQGCKDCLCHQNGSVSCDPNSGSCTCKANVAGLNCSVCANEFYDVGPDLGPDDCQPCGCDSRGVVPGQVCNKQTGQCPCKDDVQGRQCNECKDTYYNLQINQQRGCLPCDCNRVGSISDVCHRDTGRCPCQAQVESGNRICSPQVSHVEPRFGPVIGGTVITIRGQLLGNSSQVPSVFLGNASGMIIKHNITTVLVKTAGVSSTGVVSISLSWADERLPTVTEDFSYMPNPTLDTSSLPDISMFRSGGCGATFKGSNFGSVAAPQISVTTPSNETTYGSCRHINQDLKCTTPDLGGQAVSSLRFGIKLDGVLNMDLGPVTVLDDPVLNDLGSHDFQYPFEKTITISVKMGSHISKQVGTLNYLEFYETTYFIGIMCGIGGLILLVIVIVIFCCCRRTRRKNPNRSSAIMLVDKSANGSSNTENQYSELPNAGFVNEGFHGPIQQEAVIRPRPKDAPLPTASDVDLMTEFLNRVEASLWDPIKSAMVSASHLARGNVCTNSGKFARIIDGQFSTTRAGQKHETKVTIKAIKEKLPEGGMLPMWATGSLRECLRLHRYGSDNVLSIMGLALDKERFYLVYPYMQNRTLKDHIIDPNKEFSIRQLVEYGLQVADGLSYLNTVDIVHKDLATRNCWVDAEHVVKIGDASFAWDFYGEEYVYDSARERHVPLRWMAPESLTDGYYDMRTDVWSLGIVLWELLTRGCLPFHEVEDGRVKDYILDGYQLGKPENCSDNLYELMKECWNSENEHRPHVSSMVKLLGDELSGSSVEQDDIYVNLDTKESYYQNENALGKARRKAPPPPART